MDHSSRESTTTADDSCKRKRVDDASNGEDGHRQQDVDISFKRPKLAPTSRLLRNGNSNSGHDDQERKKRMGSSKNQGKLSVFMGLPLDVLAEITSYLLPLDILYLSRVSKNFRELFNPHVSRHMWVAARMNVPSLPERPKDLNEAQYASLLFEHHCQACNAQRAHIVDFSLRCRTCKACYEELTKVGYSIVSAISGVNNLREVICSLAPFSTHKTSDVDFSYVNPFRRYNIAELTAVAQQYKKLEGNEELRKKFVQERQETTRMMMETAEAMENWLTASRRGRREKNDDTASNRHAEICKRLFELGWTQKDIDDNNLKNGDMRKMMYQPRPLTPMIWKRIYPKMEKIMIATRFISRRREFKASWRLVVEKLVPAQQRVFIPTALEALNLPSIGALLNHNNAGDVVNVSRIEEVMSQALKESESHQIMVKRDLLKRIYKAKQQPLSDGQESLPQVDEKISPDDPCLFYACHRFECGCYGRRPTFSVVELYNHFIASHEDCLENLTWADLGVFYQSSASQIVKELLELVGVAEDARMEDIPPFHGKLECACGNPSIKGKRFGFWSLVEHVLDENRLYEEVIRSGRDKKKPKTLNEEQMQICDDHELSKLQSLIKVLSDKYPGQTLDSGCPPNKIDTVICVPCRVLSSSWEGVNHRMNSQEEVEYHLKAKHGLEFKCHYVSAKWWLHDW